MPPQYPILLDNNFSRSHTKPKICKFGNNKPASSTLSLSSCVLVYGLSR